MGIRHLCTYYFCDDYIIASYEHKVNRMEVPEIEYMLIGCGNATHALYKKEGGGFSLVRVLTVGDEMVEAAKADQNLADLVLATKNLLDIEHMEEIYRKHYGRK